MTHDTELEVMVEAVIAAASKNCEHDSRSHCLENDCAIHEPTGWNEGVEAARPHILAMARAYGDERERRGRDSGERSAVPLVGTLLKKLGGKAEISRFEQMMADTLLVMVSENHATGNKEYVVSDARTSQAEDTSKSTNNN